MISKSIFGWGMRANSLTMIPVSTGGGPPADYVRSVNPEMQNKIREAVQRAYLDGEADGPRSYAAIAWAVKGCVP